MVKQSVSERHRHRWEFNNKYLEQFEKAGMIASGKNPGTGLVEIIEIADHPFFIGVQYHPELKSTVENPQPIFVHFVKAAKAHAERTANVKKPNVAKGNDLERRSRKSEVGSPSKNSD